MLLDEDGITQHVQELVRQRSSSRYARQKSALEWEFAHFLASLTTLKSLVSALPGCVIAVLVWKDKRGKTKVQGPTSRALNIPGLTCACPTRLAFGTVYTLIGKLRAIVAENGRGSEWHSQLGVGNPAACRLVKAYLPDIREEQLKKRVTPRQAEPILLGDLAVISGYLKAMLLNSSNLSPIQIFIYVRDQALFKALFFLLEVVQRICYKLRGRMFSDS